MQVTVLHKEGNSPKSMILEAKTSKSSFEIKPSVISPVEYFLAGAISCSVTDMVMLPKNHGYAISEIEVTGDVNRAETSPQKFNEVHLTYSFKSDGDDLLARRWVLSTLETYCSTLNTIRGVSKITFSIIHNGDQIANKNEIVSGETHFQPFSDKNAPDIGGACEA